MTAETPSPTRVLARPESTIGLGIALMLLGDFLFATNDVMGKWLVATYSVGQLLVIRSAAGLLIMAPLVFRGGLRPLFDLEQPRVQVLRVLFATLEVYFFYWAVSYLPIADVMVFYLAAPIYVAALSPWLLGEKVGWRRWTAIVIGFCGVVVALRPSSETLSLASLISIAGSLTFALLIIQSRQLRSTSDTVLVFWQTVGALVGGAIFAPFNWVHPTGFDFTLLALLGVVAVFAHVLITRALKMAPAALLAPIHYTLLLWAIVYGYFVFGDVPDTTMLLGAAVIVGAGLFIVFRERVVKGEVTAPPEGVG